MVIDLQRRYLQSSMRELGRLEEKPDPSSHSLCEIFHSTASQTVSLLQLRLSLDAGRVSFFTF